MSEESGKYGVAYVADTPDKIDFGGNRQVGGNHYDFPLPPVDYIHKNNLDFFQGNVVKYITRFRRKDGLKDLLKARHYIDMLIEREYSNDDLANMDFENVE